MAQKSNCKNYDTGFYFIAKYKSVLVCLFPEFGSQSNGSVPMSGYPCLTAGLFGFFFLPPSTMLNISGLPVKAGR